MKRKMHIGYLLSQVTKAYAKRQELHFQKHGITLSFEQYTIVATLGKMGPLSQKHLARFSGRDFTSCSRIIKTLERDGYVTRMINPDDKRGQIISNTEKSQCIYTDIEKIRKQTTEEMFQGIAHDENEVCALLEQMLVNLGDMK